MGEDMEAEPGNAPSIELAQLRRDRKELLQVLGDILHNPRVVAIVDRFAPQALVAAKSTMQRLEPSEETP